jgi:hypothetical protein
MKCKKIEMRLVLLIALTFVSTIANATPIFLETYDRKDSLYQSGGWILEGSDSFLGVRFSVEEYLHLDAVVANLGGQGSFFSAITEIDNMSSTPLVAPGFEYESLLFYAENNFEGNLSRDIRTNVGITLGPGSYVIFFGGLGDFGGNDFGWMPGAWYPEDSNIPLSDYLEYRSGPEGWVEFPESRIRVVLEGQVSAVPIPAAVWLFGSSLGLLAWLRRRTTA